MKANIKTIIFAAKFMLKNQGSLFYKIKVVPRYSQLYHFHLSSQINLQKLNYSELLEKRAKAQAQSKDYYRKIIDTYFSLKKTVLDKSKQSFEAVKDDKVRQEGLRSIMRIAFQNLTLFYQSLQQLVQGRRQVLQNQNFVFQDGQTVKQKSKKFQAFLNQFLGKHEQKKQDNTEQEQ